MLITERLWCDFVVWSPHGMHIQRIPFNPNFIIEIAQKASDFHQNILTPEYFEMRVPRQLIPFDLSDDCEN